MVPYSLIVKPVGSACDLACSYCYYREDVSGVKGLKVMPTEILELIISEYARDSKGRGQIAWHGGEPLLAGIDFFKEAMYLENKYGTQIYNAMQTNGTLITDAFAEIFRKNKFLIGVSIDGPKEVHDSRRFYDGESYGSYDLVMQGVSLLRKKNVEFNVLTVIGQHNVTKATILFDFYDKNDFNWLQFIPQMKFTSFLPSVKTKYDITPEQYYNFLSEFFKLWYKNKIGIMSVRFFDNILQSYLQQTPDICTMQERCPDHLVLDVNGDVYPCDLFHNKYWKIGNIKDMEIAEAIKTEKYRNFHKLKPNLPSKCKTCKWLKNCYGGCPRNRISESDNNEKDYFCETYLSFFEAFDRKFRAMRDMIEHLDKASSAISTIGR